LAYERLVLGWLVNGIGYFHHKVYPGCFHYFWLSGVTAKVVIRGSREEAFKKNKLRMFWRVFATNLSFDLTEVLIDEN